MDIQRLKGQEHVKRTLEVAAAGKFSVTLTAVSSYADAVNFVYPIAMTLGVAELHILEPCACGNYGSVEFTCYCSPELLTRYSREYRNKRAECADIHVEMPRITYEKLTSSRLGETTEMVKERIAKMGQYTDLTLDAASQSLMKAAVRQLAIDQTAYERTIKVARTIANLAHSKQIGAAHLAEAVQYRPRKEQHVTL